jgi:4-diphosphocytidyl-2-C-methyl-D-erythritol kinase
MIFDAPAKINLSLRVLAREASGFHQIESLFCALDLCDEVEVDRFPDAIVVNVQAGTDNHDRDTSNVFALSAAPRSNLVHRAATAFFGAAGLDAGARITLVKRIPIGAGLGGGSSDAAATLVALNELYGRVLDPPTMLDIGGGLGSDIPFFLSGASLALAWGRGTRLLPLPALEPMSVLLVAPAESVSTADAYSALAATRTPAYAPPPAVLNPARCARWADVASDAVNDFEPIVFEKIPELARIRADLERNGALPARLTGTGSVVFGVFDSDDAAGAAAASIREKFRNVHTILTRTAARPFPF